MALDEADILECEGCHSAAESIREVCDVAVMASEICVKQHTTMDDMVKTLSVIVALGDYLIENTPRISECFCGEQREDFTNAIESGAKIVRTWLERKNSMADNNTETTADDQQ